MNKQLSQNIKSFQRRWNAKWDDAPAFIQFKNRVLYLIEKHLAEFIVGQRHLINKYAYLCGLEAPYSMSGELNSLRAISELRSEGFRATIIYSTFMGAQQPIHLAWYLQNLFSVIGSLPTAKEFEDLRFGIDSFYLELKELVNTMPISQMRLTKNRKGINVYPAGAKLLDENLVNQNLEWLQDYPESLKAFEQALSIYSSGDKLKFRNLIDNLRVAIEQLLRKILSNQKSLENQSKELDSWLEKHGVHKQVRNLYGQLLFNQYKTLQNDVAKHGDIELLSEEIEYLIYLTGTFMRLIIQLRRSEV